ncbi:Cullin-domain-containing protein [Obba rivulosa]|uniref:Cullin-domain-containing protein n=1 Tax=Obba rivulosa TaxID=1052685 RepID=A0A8E2DLC3_9APHY|nr:Cullin-domain-containing protein [Obba rivulosa]
MATTARKRVPGPGVSPAEASEFLEEGADHIMRLQSGMSYIEYLGIYTAVYNYITSSKVHNAGDDPDLGLRRATYIARGFFQFTQYALAVVQWKQNFFMHVQQKHQRLTGAILRLIERHRNGATIDQSLIKKTIDSFISLGIDERDINKVPFEVCREHFELPFLETTENYYRQESEAMLAENSVAGYLKKAEERLREEEDWVERYLNTNNCEPLIGCARTYSFANRPSLLEYGKEEDLQSIYSLFTRIPEGPELLCKEFEEHVKRAGLAAVTNLVGKDGAGIEYLDPYDYVSALLEVHQKNPQMVNRGFRGEAEFIASLDKACREFVNCNVAGTSTAKSPELLAMHTHALLHMDNEMAEEDLESALNQVMVLLKYKDNTDVFQTYYMVKLSRRLVRGVSASDETEASMVSKLKEACGFDYADKLRLVTDKRLSKELSDQFKEHMQQNQEMDMSFGIMVLGTNFWPLNAQHNEFIVPTDICRWRSFCGTLSLDELFATTAIDKEILKQVLAVLVRARILTNEKAGRYNLNFNFKAKKIRLNLNTTDIKVEHKAESHDVLNIVDEGRKYVIQATIVRIMKARKTMKNQALIQEVISQISQRFLLKISNIEKAIDDLLEKEYIKRIEGTRDTFARVA